MTNGGANAVTIRKTCLAPADKPVLKKWMYALSFFSFWVAVCVFEVFFPSKIEISAVFQVILPETTMSPPGQTIVSNRTLDADTKPTRRHFVVDVTFSKFAFIVVVVVVVVVGA